MAKVSPKQGLKKPITKQKVVKKAPVASKKRFALPTLRQIGHWLAYPFVTTYRKLRTMRTRAVHKSFVRTRRRDKIKKPKVEGFFSFPWYVVGVLWVDRWLFFRFITIFLILSTTLLGALQVSNNTFISQLIDTAGETAESVVEPVTRAFVVVSASLAGTLNSNLSEVQYLALVILNIFTGLVVVWLLRQRLAGNDVKVRDGLYSAGAPILSLFVLFAVAIVQLIPLGFVSLAYVGATTGGLLNGGIETAMFAMALFLAAVVTLYFVTTTVFSIFIATIPGTYPFKAYSISKDIVSGQRMRLLFRLLWMVVILLLMWFVVLVPVVIITNSLGGQNSVVIPFAVQLMSGLSLLYGTAYAYLLYRRMIDDPVEEK